MEKMVRRVENEKNVPSVARKGALHAGSENVPMRVSPPEKAAAGGPSSEPDFSISTSVASPFGTYTSKRGKVAHGFQGRGSWLYSRFQSWLGETRWSLYGAVCSEFKQDGIGLYVLQV